MGVCSSHYVRQDEGGSTGAVALRPSPSPLTRPLLVPTPTVPSSLQPPGQGSAKDGHDGGGDEIGGNDRRFAFNVVFGLAATQAELCADMCGGIMVRSVFRGFDATILA